MSDKEMTHTAVHNVAQYEEAPKAHRFGFITIPACESLSYLVPVIRAHSKGFFYRPIYHVPSMPRWIHLFPCRWWVSCMSFTLWTCDH